MGQVTHLAIHLREVRQREFRRMLALSAIAHLALPLLLLAEPSPPAVFLPGVVAVELVAAPAPPSPPRPVARPAPVPKKLVLPEQPAIPKPAPKAKPKLAKKQPAPEPVEHDYRDVLEQLRADAGEIAPEPAPPPPAPQPMAESGSAVGRPFPPRWRPG